MKEGGRESEREGGTEGQREERKEGKKPLTNEKHPNFQLLQMIQ